MSRRAAVLLVSGLLSAVLAVTGVALPVPYAATAPGPTYDTLGTIEDEPIILVDGRETYPSDGELRLVTVEVSGKPRSMTLGEAIAGWLDPKVAVVPLDLVFPPDQTGDDVERENQLLMEQSQLAAKAAALTALGEQLTIVVGSVDEGMPAEGVLEAGDEFVAIDGEPVDTVADLTRRISDREPGDPVEVTYVRDGERRTETVGTAPAPGDEDRPILGVRLDFALPFEVEIQLPRVGGPSAGLMFALAIYDKLTAEDVTAGRTIAGSGTVDLDGNVGPIGGIQQKLWAAQRDGATVFLIAEGNCPAVEETPAGLQLVAVSTLQDAVDDLELLSNGGTPQGCP